MIPDERFSSETFKGVLLNPWSRDRKLSYHWGPREVQDPSQGLLVKVWTLRAVGASAVLSAPGSPARTLFTRSVDLGTVTLAFDQNGRPCVCFEEEGGGAYLFWFDPSVNQEVFYQVPGGATSPRITMDDARAFNTGNSDVILAYVRAGLVRYRRQRDRFDTEFTPLVGEGGSPAPATALRHVSMNSNLRLEFLTDGPGEEPWTVADIVEDLVVSAGVPPELVDVRELYDDTVPGLMVAVDEGLDKPIDWLRDVFFFDRVEHDRKIRFPKRGREVVARIPYEDLVEGNPMALAQTIVDETRLPREVNINHTDPAGGFAKNKQTATRRSNMVQAEGKENIETQVVLTADQAATAALTKLKMRWAELITYEFQTTLKWTELTPTDIVEVQDARGDWHCMRLEERNEDNGIISWEARQDGGSRVYARRVHGNSLPPPTSTTPGVLGETRIEILNLSPRRDSEDELGLYIAAAGDTSAWSGYQMLVSTDNGAVYEEAYRHETPATLGEIETELPDAVGYEYQPAQAVDVVVNFPLASVTYEQLLGGLNHCVIGDEDMQFQTAQLLGMDGSRYRYRLSGLVRARRGTAAEQWTAGTRFVLVDDAVTFVQVERWMLGMDLAYKPVTLGLSEDETTPTFYLFDEARSQTEWQPAHVRAERDGSGVTVDWVGRARLGMDTRPYHSKYFEGYRVRFSDGHTISTSQQTATYTGAPAGLTVQVCAVNSITGEGPYSDPIEV